MFAVRPISLPRSLSPSPKSQWRKMTRLFPAASSPSSPSFLHLALPQLVRLKGSSDTHALSILGPGDRRHIARLLLAFRRGTKSH